MIDVIEKANPITAFFSWLSAPVTQWLKNRGEIDKAKHTRELAVINNQARLAQSQSDNNHEWEMANLQDKDKWLRRISFIQFSAPIWTAVISPEHGAIVFDNLNGVPNWLIQTYIAINGAIWGITSLKNVAPQLLGQLAAIKRRGEHGA